MKSHMECRTDPLLEVAVELEKVAMSDEYFIKRGESVNVVCGCVRLHIALT